ncbi:2,3-bisphosphoglycerate-independent phosphoglycerate mutase, partial [Candidatus Peregrinibacteria bacterium]|nr:2,3-bisphosphoglycerate-independent phosphoglycerate mutase [Candidatus Peregrinibacteria bacterium]
MPSTDKVLLVILDGFGEGKDYRGNAIARARKPNLNRLRSRAPGILLKASGRAVGIPEGTQGGSEVGHFTIGAGRVVLQPLETINESI